VLWTFWCCRLGRGWKRVARRRYPKNTIAHGGWLSLRTRAAGLQALRNAPQALIDVVMISNLLIMVIVGGYATFVSRMDLDGHPDQQEWLSHVNASVLKVKLATAIIGISSIHLLKTFINADNYTDRVLIAQTVMQIAFLLSALAIAYTDKVMSGIAAQKH
jgi:uncharacterized protein (TIGR00645 family)